MSKYTSLTFNGRIWLVKTGCEKYFTNNYKSKGIMKKGRLKTIEIWELNGITAYVKHYTRRTIVSCNLAKREFKGVTAAAERGLNVIEPIAAHLHFMGGTLIFSEIKGYKPLVEKFADKMSFCERRNLIKKFAEFSRQVHDAGVFQDDFNPTNVLYSEGNNFLLVDFERVDISNKLSEKKRFENLAGMNRTIGFTLTERVAFLIAYLGSKNWKNAVREIYKLYLKKHKSTIDKLISNCVRENRNFGILDMKNYKIFYRKEAVEKDVLAKLAQGSFEGLIKIDSNDAISDRKKEITSHKNSKLPLACFKNKDNTKGFLLFRNSP